MVILFRRRFIILFTLFLIAIIIVFIYINMPTCGYKDSRLFLGGQLRVSNLSHLEDIEVSNEFNRINIDEKYFRPSRLPILNDGRIDSDFLFAYWGKKPQDIVVPVEFLKTPQDAILNYFRIIKHGENLVEDKIGGCGSVGDSSLPFHLTYNFFTMDYKKNNSFEIYLKSFEGIGHTNLIKLQRINGYFDKPNLIMYFIEIETIEGSDRGITYFAYYYGFVYLANEGDSYKIANIEYYGQDFLCASYHGWSHLAEANVDTRYGNWCGLVKERYPTEQDGYIKSIYFKGTDDNDYKIVFFELTNGTDIEIEQFIKNTKGQWENIRLNPEKCLNNN